MLIGLTGGIATGKSTLFVLLQELQDFSVFDADKCVHQLLSADIEVISSVQRELSLPTEQPLDRSLLRQIVFSDPAKRQRLEAILHPVVRAQWQAQAAEYRTGGNHFLADIPLLFETGGAGLFDATIVVAASVATQEARLATRGLEASMIDAMLASQWPIGQKIALADHVIWNDGSEAGLRRQASLLLQQILPRAA